MFINFIWLEHAGMYEKAMKIVSKFKGKYQRNFWKKKQETKSTQGKKMKDDPVQVINVIDDDTFSKITSGTCEYYLKNL